MSETREWRFEDHFFNRRNWGDTGPAPGRRRRHLPPQRRPPFGQRMAAAKKKP